MAIKVSVTGEILKILPLHNYFNINEMEHFVGGWPYPIKIGPIWVIQNEELIKTQEDKNNLASRFFRSNMFGDILILSSHELPAEWDLLDDNDKKYTPEEIEAGFIKSLTEMVIYENFYYPINSPELKNVNKHKKTEYIYSPEKQKVFDEDFKVFLKNAFDHIIENKEDFIVYKDENNIVKVENKNDKLKTLEQMLNIFVEEENYEVAAKIRDLKFMIEGL
jgi:hypothetical protein